MAFEDIIVRPIITEKSSFAMSEGKYTFEVSKKATKVDVRNAVEKLFGVKVVNVSTVNVKGKPKRQGVHAGKTSDWKKAIVKIDRNPSDVSYLEKGGKSVTANKKYNTEIADFNPQV